MVPRSLLLLLGLLCVAAQLERRFLLSFDQAWVNAVAAMDGSSASRNDSARTALLNLMPMPRSLRWPRPAWSLLVPRVTGSGLSSLAGVLPGVVLRFQARLAAFARDANSTLSNVAWGEPADGVGRTLQIRVAFSKVVHVPQFGDDESYSLNVGSVDASAIAVNISANTTTGIVRAFSALLQLVAVRTSDGALLMPVNVTISDRPAMLWRGLMVDVARRYHSLASLQRVCDGLEFARMNVLHLHMTDDQGWRFQSLKWPRLNTNGTTDGLFYRQSDLASLVSHCASGGIRVVPEIDIPCHSAAAVFAYGSLAPDNVPRPFVNDWGTYDYCLDPSVPSASQFVRDIVAEVASVFPDNFLHVGGDEVQWPSPSPRQTKWMASNNVTLDTLQDYFLTKIAFPAVRAVGRRPMGWDDIFWATGDGKRLPNTTAIQWWTDAAVDPSVVGIVSTGFFLDSMLTGAQLYGSVYLEGFPSGAEACAWSEAVGDNLEARVFPSVLAFAELTWRGPANVLSVDNMYYRMFVQDYCLQHWGVLHRQIYSTQVAAAVNGTFLWNLSDVQIRDGQDTRVFDLLIPSPIVSSSVVPLHDLLDLARPDSVAAQMMVWLARMSLGPERMDPAGTATAWLTQWLLGLSQMNSSTYGPALASVTTDARDLASALLRWIEALQFGTGNTTALRLAALSSGADSFPGVFDPSKVVYGALKQTVVPVLLARDLRSFNYSRLVASVVVSTSGQQTATAPAALSTLSAPVIAGICAGIVVLLAALVAGVAWLAFRNRARLKVLAAAGLGSTAEAPPSGKEWADDSAVESAVDYLDEDDSLEPSSIIAERVFEFSSESISSVSTSAEADDDEDAVGYYL